MENVDVSKFLELLNAFIDENPDISVPISMNTIAQNLDGAITIETAMLVDFDIFKNNGNYWWLAFKLSPVGSVLERMNGSKVRIIEVFGLTCNVEILED